MKIDWHCHVHPPEQAARSAPNGQSPFRIERLVEAHRENGYDLAVVSNTMSYMKSMRPPEALSAIKTWNDYAAELQRDYPDDVVALSATWPAAGDDFLKEFERGIRECGLKGVLINANQQGVYPDNDGARGFYELVSELQVPVFIHTAPSLETAECLQDYRLDSSVGRPFDECLAIARLIVRGILEDFPTIDFVGAHLGGGICEVIGRMDFAYNLGDQAAFLGPYEPLKISRPPSAYLKRMYLDTVSYHTPAILCALMTVGAERLVLGSDAPPLLPMLPEAHEAVEALPIADEAKERILSGNALRLLGSPIRSA